MDDNRASALLPRIPLFVTPGVVRLGRARQRLKTLWE